MKRALKFQTTRVLVFVASTGFIGCSVGPNFKNPPPPDTGSYTQHPLRNPNATSGMTGGGAQRFVQDLDIPAQWWVLFHSKPLNTLVEDSLRANPSIKAAQNALIVARENLFAQAGAFYPSASAGLMASRQSTSQALAPVSNSNSFQFNLITPQVLISYSPDVFGLNRRTV